MSHVTEPLSTESGPLLTTQRITSSPTSDGRPALVENTSLNPVGTELGTGLIGEEDVWDGHYSFKNFLGQIAWRTLATCFFVPLTIATWNNGRDDAAFFAILTGIALVCFWAVLSYRILSAYLGRHYRLTNRRLFVSSGLLRRQQNQMELADVKDVSIRQTFLGRWLGLGTVVVVPKGQEMPVFNLAGVAEPNRVIDLIWHHARVQESPAAPAA